MRQRQLEEEKSRFRAIVLSVFIHAALFGLIVYSGYELKQKMGSGYTEFIINEQPRQGVQTEVIAEANSSINQAASVKDIPAKAASKAKAKAPSPKAAVENNNSFTDDLPVDAAQKEEPSPLAEPKVDAVETPLQPEQNLEDTKDLTEDFQEDLKALNAEDSTSKEANSQPQIGNDEIDSPEQNAEYGDPGVVRSYKELLPMSGNRKPVYPARLQRLRIEDTTIVVDFYVMPNGRVRDIRVVQNSPYPDFLESVVKEVKLWRFSPGKTGYFRQDFVFRLNQPTQVIPERLRRK